MYKIFWGPLGEVVVNSTTADDAIPDSATIAKIVANVRDLLGERRVEVAWWDQEGGKMIAKAISEEIADVVISCHS